MKNSSIMNFVSSKADYSNLPELLPLMHSCDGYHCESVIENGILDTTECPVFHEKLLYFFYGKSSYPVSENVDGTRTDTIYCPVCFILDTAKIDIYRIFPFDSGGFQAGLYESFIHRHMKIESFEINNSISDIKAYISAVFHNNMNYLIGESMYTTDENDTCLNSLFKMLSANGSFKIDERANTIEIISNKPVSIKDAVKGVVLPENLLRKKQIADFISRNNIRHYTYTIRNLTAPSRYNEVVYQLAKNFL